MHAWSPRSCISLSHAVALFGFPSPRPVAGRKGKERKGKGDDLSRRSLGPSCHEHTAQQKRVSARPSPLAIAARLTSRSKRPYLVFPLPPLTDRQTDRRARAPETVKRRRKQAIYLPRGELVLGISDPSANSSGRNPPSPPGSANPRDPNLLFFCFAPCETP
ncbi:hypothetical protein LY76DRAFT_202437 [Colletotrichum caudatum]|nr:hypothetical protein LY76DRAFT_202437 [Colletotrichum caudatum]